MEEKESQEVLETENAIAEMKRTKQRKDEDEANLLAQIAEMESQIEKRRAGRISQGRASVAGLTCRSSSCC